MTLYRIRDWDTTYETAETRKLEFLRWTPMPNKHDGLGFRRVASQRDRCELLAAWVLIVQIASKGRRGQRGVLARDCKALTAEDLELMTGFPAAIFSKALSFFSDPRQGWLVADAPVGTPAPEASASEQSGGSPSWPAQSPGAPADSPARPADSPAEWKEGKEEKGTEGNVGAASSLEDLAADISPVVLTFPCAGPVRSWPLQESFLVRLRSLYPGVDAKAQCELALAKIEQGAVTKKTSRGMPKFLFSWMDRATNRAPSAGYSRPARKMGFA